MSYQDLYVVLYIAFMLVCIFILCIGLAKPYRIRRNVFFVMLCLFVIGWFVSEIAGTSSGNSAGYCLAFAISLVFLQLAASTILLFAISFYRLPLMPPLWVRILIYVFPATTAIIAFAPVDKTIFGDFSQIPATLSDIIGCLGPFVWIQTVYCYFFIIFAVAVVIYGHIHIPKFYRSPSMLVVFAIGLIPIFHIMAFTGLWRVPVPPFALAFCTAIVLSNFALANNDENIFIRYARGSVFKYLNEYILVLGNNGNVVDSNPSASALFKAQGIKPVAHSLGDILDLLSEKGAIIEPGPDGGDSTDISLTNGEFLLVLNLCVHEINDNKNRKIGSLAVFSDVTGNRAFLDMLEEKAGMDSLTGLANRTAYQGARKRLDTSEYLPLSVIISDINGLKTVNDTLGHKHGDKMIQSIARILESMCPKSGFLARIGGDEFIFLLPRTDEQASAHLIKQIRNELRLKTAETSYDLSSAMGTATKYSANQNLEDVIDLADSLMYKDKKRIKKG